MTEQTKCAFCSNPATRLFKGDLVCLLHAHDAPGGERAKDETCGILFGGAFGPPTHVCNDRKGHGGFHSHSFASPRPAEPSQDEPVIQALRNSGIDVECGACMEVAFTGVTTNAHTCAPRPAEPEPPKAEQEPTKKPEDCQHEVFRAQVGVGRMEDSGRFTADITVWCVECGEPFRFLGVDGGLSFREPRVSVDGLELRAPIEPQVTPRLIAHAAYEMPTIPRKN